MDFHPQPRQIAPQYVDCTKPRLVQTARNHDLREKDVDCAHEYVHSGWMLLGGRIRKVEGVWWSAEAPVAGVFTQGKSRKDAKLMLADALEALINRPGFRVTVSDHGPGGEVLVETSDPAALAAYVLKYQRSVHRLSLAQVATSLGSSSRNLYARYERGDSVPSIDKFAELLRAVAPELAVVITERAPSSPATSGAVAKRRKG